MKTLMLGVASLSVALSALAAETGPTNATQYIQRQTGGHLTVLHQNTKKVYYVNAQKRVSKAVIDAARLKFGESLKTPMDYAEGTFEFSAPKIEGELSLYIIDDEKLPISLVAPEGRWAFVNVAPLAKGRGEKPQYFEARVKKELARVACMLFGGLSSTYNNNLLSLVTSAEELDKFERDVLPIDGTMRCSRYLLSLGVKPYRRVTYRKACQEGWAPQPTNDIQKAIWDKVHEIPSKPIKIEYNEKRDKGK